MPACRLVAALGRRAWSPRLVVALLVAGVVAILVYFGRAEGYAPADLKMNTWASPLSDLMKMNTSASPPAKSDIGRVPPGRPIEDGVWRAIPGTSVLKDLINPVHPRFPDQKPQKIPPPLTAAQAAQVRVMDALPRNAEYYRRCKPKHRGRWVLFPAEKPCQGRSASGMNSSKDLTCGDPRYKNLVMPDHFKFYIAHPTGWRTAGMHPRDPFLAKVVVNGKAVFVGDPNNAEDMNDYQFAARKAEDMVQQDMELPPWMQTGPWMARDLPRWMDRHCKRA